MTKPNDLTVLARQYAPEAVRTLVHLARESEDLCARAMAARMLLARLDQNDELAEMITNAWLEHDRTST